MVNTTKTRKTKMKAGGLLEPAHLVIPRYATAPAKKVDGEIWYDTTNSKLKINLEGTVKEINTDA